MYTVVETLDFQKQAAKLWLDEERTAFVVWIATNALAGDVIPGADGARKVRWSLAGKGKRGGVRVIYFHLGANGVLLLVAVYAKSDQANLPISSIKRM